MSCWLEHEQIWKQLSIIGSVPICGSPVLWQASHHRPSCITVHLSPDLCSDWRKWSNCVAESRCAIQHLHAARVMLFHLNELSFPSCTVPFPLFSHSRSFCPSLMPSSHFWVSSRCLLSISSYFQHLFINMLFPVQPDFWLLACLFGKRWFLSFLAYCIM